MLKEADTGENRRMRGCTAGAKQVGVLFFYLMLALIMTYPLAAHFTHGVLGPPGDNFEYLYKLQWFKRALFNLAVSPFFTADIFYPEGYHLALHEMSLANIALGMPLTILFGETISYNVLVLLSFVLSGFGAYLLVLHLTCEGLAALLSGIVYAFCSYRMAHLGAGHLNLLGTQWLPFFFMCLEQVLEGKGVLSAILLGVFFALSSLSSWYYASIAAIFAVVYILWQRRPWWERLFNRRLWLLFAVSALVASLLMAPGIMPTVRQWSQREMAFSLREVDTFSASIGDFFVPNSMHPFWGERTASYYVERQDVPEHIIALSWVAMVLAVAALWPRRKQPASAYALLLGLSFILALGTTLHLGGQRVYITVPAWIERVFTTVIGLLAKRLALHPTPTYYDLRVAGAIYVPMPALLCYLWGPFFDAMRVWTRFGLISAFAVAVLAGIGLARILRGADDAARRWRGALLGLLCLAVAVFELVAVPYPLGWSEVRAQSVDRWLAQQTGTGAVAQFPLGKAESGPGLYATTVHTRPIVYGYGAFFPRRYRQVRPVLWAFPTAQAIALLREWGVRYVLVGARSYGAQWPDVQGRIGQFEALHLVATFNEESVYHGGWLAESLPDFGSAFVVDHIYVYELK